METSKERFSQFLRRRRRELGLSQEDLADIAGISANYLAKLETEKREPGLKALKRLSEALKVPMDELFHYLLYTWPPSFPSNDHEFQKEFTNFPPDVQKLLVQIGRILDNNL